MPRGGLLLTAGVDVQADRLEVAVWAWGRGEEAWLIDYQQILGDPLKQETWEQLVHVTSRDYPHESGSSLRIRATCIDSGYLTQEVYHQVRKFKYLHWFAINGIPYTLTSPKTSVLKWLRFLSDKAYSLNLKLVVPMSIVFGICDQSQMAASLNHRSRKDFS